MRRSINKKILIALPAFNEAKVIANVIKEIQNEGYRDILVVDDASTDETFKLAKKTGAKAVKHIINRGAGGATATALEYAKRNNYDSIVFLDSDGQHSPKDIRKLLVYSQKYDVIIGSRMIEISKEMPIQRKIANFIGSLLTLFFFGKFAWDSQSGFKVFNKKAIDSINLTFDRYEFCSEILGECYRNSLNIKEVPIKVIYTNHSLGKVQTGQSISNGFKMVFKFLFK